jgi:hypothetical protein
VAVAVLELGLVVPDGQQLDALPPPGRGELGELLDGRAVARLVQAHEQPGVEHPVGLGGGQLLGLVDHHRHEQFEEWAEPPLFAGGGIQVESVVGPGQQLVEIQVAALGRGRDGGVAVDVEERLGGAIDRAHGVVGATRAGRPGIQGLGVADLHQGLGDVVDVLDVHPAGHVGHASPRAGGGEQQDRQQLGAKQLPVVGVLGPMAADVGRVGQHPPDPSGVGVAAAILKRRPARPRHPAQPEGVVDPDGPEVGPVGAGGAEDVGFDGGGDQIPLPLQDGRDDQPVGLEGAGWAEGQHRVALFDGQVEAAEKAVADAVAAAQDDPPSPGPEDQEPAQLPPAGPPRATLSAPSARAGGQQPDQQAIQQRWNPEGEHRGGVHADRTGQQRLGGRRPGLGRVIPGPR